MRRQSPGGLVEPNAHGHRLRAALGFIQIAPPRAPELRLLHHWLETWTGVGLIAVGVEHQGYRLSLDHIEVVTRRELLRTTRRRHRYAVSGFAPYVFRGQRQAGYCTVIESVVRRRDEPQPVGAVARRRRRGLKDSGPSARPTWKSGGQPCHAGSCPTFRAALFQN